jgi:dihydroorotate dehydrogenase
MAEPEYALAGRALETPLVNAAGSISGVNSESICSEVRTLSRTAIGAITVGSFTVEERAGNEAEYGSPVYWHDSEDGFTHNALGLPNIGLTAAKRLLPDLVSIAHDYGKPLIASVSPALSGDGMDNTAQLRLLVEELLPTGVDLIEINTSCPNVIGRDGVVKPIMGHDTDAMDALVKSLPAWVGSSDGRIGIKVPPYCGPKTAIISHLSSQLAACPEVGFVTVCNTLPNTSPYSFLSTPPNVGGISGPVTKYVGRTQLEMWRNALPPDAIDIISALGIDSGRELAIRRQLGAAVGSGVTFLWESSNWGDAVTDMLTEWSDHET